MTEIKSASKYKAGCLAYRNGEIFNEFEHQDWQNGWLDEEAYIEEMRLQDTMYYDYREYP